MRLHNAVLVGELCVNLANTQRGGRGLPTRMRGGGARVHAIGRQGQGIGRGVVLFNNGDLRFARRRSPRLEPPHFQNVWHAGEIEGARRGRSGFVGVRAPACWCVRLRQTEAVSILITQRIFPDGQQERVRKPSIRCITGCFDHAIQRRLLRRADEDRHCRCRVVCVAVVEAHATTIGVGQMPCCTRTHGSGTASERIELWRTSQCGDRSHDSNKYSTKTRDCGSLESCRS